VLRLRRIQALAIHRGASEPRAAEVAGLLGRAAALQLQQAAAGWTYLGASTRADDVASAEPGAARPCEGQFCVVIVPASLTESATRENLMVTTQDSSESCLGNKRS